MWATKFAPFNECLLLAVSEARAEPPRSPLLPFPSPPSPPCWLPNLLIVVISYTMLKIEREDVKPWVEFPGQDSFWSWHRMGSIGVDEEILQSCFCPVIHSQDWRFCFGELHISPHYTGLPISIRSSTDGTGKRHRNPGSFLHVPTKTWANFRQIALWNPIFMIFCGILIFFKKIIMCILIHTIWIPER